MCRSARAGSETATSVTASEDEGTWLDKHLADRSQQEHRALESSREARSLMARVLPRVASKDRAALYLLDGECRSVAEVAEIMGWSRSNVKVRAFRARRVLRKAIDELVEAREGRTS